jgi:methyltransferase (TIGR00027 family)
MTERAASATALGVAVLRAVHAVADEAPRVLDDPIAAQLVDPAALDRALDRDNPGARALRAHVVLRSRFAEERLEAAVARGVRQLVVLGAGFDTFAYRQPAWASTLRIFEADHPASQRAKRERLAAAGIAIPENVTFVAIDFATTSLLDGFAASTFDPDRPVFFSWLGVMMYLDEGAIDAVLRYVAARPEGSELAFSFASADPAASRAAEERAKALGEPWLTRFEPAALESKLHAHGFRSVTLLQPANARRYFGDRSDLLRAPERVSIGSAIVSMSP